MIEIDLLVTRSRPSFDGQVQARDCSRRQARYALRDDDEREKITRYVMMILMMIVMISSFRWVMKTIIIVSFVIIVFRKKGFDQ